jgi:uncharacterized protein
MDRMIFVNLPVTDVAVARGFYGALGFGFNEQFSDDSTACCVISDTICVMLMTEQRFKDFVVGDVADATTTTEVLNCLSCESREEVDGFLAKALASGGKQWLPLMEEGPMYGGSFQDPDGHVWEVLHMDPSALS